MRPEDERYESDAPQAAIQADIAGSSSEAMAGIAGGTMPGWQGSAEWMQPTLDTLSGWDAMARTGYSMSYSALQQPQLLAPKLHTQLQIRSGVIFLCDPFTEVECLQRRLFGMPASQTQIVRQIAPEVTLLFLFNVRSPIRR